ncbi:ABC transporter transmembrane region containing protein, putative [Angomonas deanei]|uniref:ABC transporter transmembrane region containing protein, putative n=1 Tax=Angomonas deanei TaxID=59799 RepID=A0A7G2CHF2_9TRYP|nr:ABC transporter transmembrane region containing protein, putative [Angomonas deanei]
MENYFFGEEDDSSRRDGGEIPPSDDNNVADTNNEYYLNILRSRARRRQRGGKVSTLYQLFTFFLHSGTAIFVAIKCLFFDFPDAEHSGGLVKVALPLLVVWINVELLFGHFYIQKGLSSTDDYRPALHVHPVYYRVEVMGTVCDQCRQLLKAEGFKCPTCNEDICSECFLSKPRATAEEKEALLHPVARAPETMEDNSEKSEEENFTSLASRCVWLFKPQWKVVLLTTFFLLATESLSIVVPKLQGHVLDTILTTTTSFKESLFIFVGVSTVVLVLGAVKSFLVSVVIRRLRVSIRQQMFDRLIYAHLRFFDATKVGTLTSRMTNDLEGMISPLESMLSNTLSDVFSVLGGLVMCVFISWRLSLVALTIIGPVAYLSKVYMTWSFYIWRRAWDSMSEANSIVTECFQNIRTIRSFSSEPREEARHSHMIGQARKNVVQDAVIFSSVMAVSDLVRTFSSVLLLGFGGYIVYSQPDHLTIGGLVTFQLYVNIMTQSFNSLLMEASDFTNSAGAAQRVFSLLNAPSVRPYNNGVQLPQMEGALTLKGGYVCLSI